MLRVAEPCCRSTTTALKPAVARVSADAGLSSRSHAAIAVSPAAQRARTGSVVTGRNRSREPGAGPVASVAVPFRDSSIWQSGGLLIRRLWVRVPPPELRKRDSAIPRWGESGANGSRGKDSVGIREALGPAEATRESEKPPEPEGPSDFSTGKLAPRGLARQIGRPTKV